MAHRSNCLLRRAVLLHEPGPELAAAAGDPNAAHMLAPLDPDTARAFIGGYGLNMKLAYDLLPPGVGPLSAENPVILGTGPLTGTVAPASARISVATKFPLGNTIGGGNGGVRMGALVKRAGYDAAVITGRAAEPVYVLIRNDDIEEMRKSTKSLMPDRILSDLTAQEAADLLAYIRSLGTAE